MRTADKNDQKKNGKRIRAAFGGVTRVNEARDGDPLSHLCSYKGPQRVALRGWTFSARAIAVYRAGPTNY